MRRWVGKFFSVNFVNGNARTICWIFFFAFFSSQSQESSWHHMCMWDVQSVDAEYDFFFFVFYIAISYVNISTLLWYFGLTRIIFTKINTNFHAALLRFFIRIIWVLYPKIKKEKKNKTNGKKKNFSDPSTVNGLLGAWFALLWLITNWDSCEC